MTGLAPLLEAHRVLVVVGAGGVGKTSTAAALAVAAARRGRRVCVVTVDPARRLADTLGTDGLGPAPTRLSIDPSGVESTDGGEAWAMMLDPKVTFDRIVRERADSEQQAERILSNRFYHRLSSSLAGIHEYMAIEELHALSRDDRFDLVVVDTPPSRHVLDLVDAPQHLVRFLDNRMYRTLIRPSSTIGRLATGPARAFTRRVASAVGGEFLDDAVKFFEGFAGMEPGFIERAEEVEATLTSDTTAFVAVAAPRLDSIEVATELITGLAARSIVVRAAVANLTTLDAWPRVEHHADWFDRTPELKLRRAALEDRHHRASAERELLAPLFDRCGVAASAHRRAGELASFDELCDLGVELLGDR